MPLSACLCCFMAHKHSLKVILSPFSLRTQRHQSAFKQRMATRAWPPVLFWLGLRWFIADPVVLGVIVVVFAMPTATMVSMLAGEYGGDEEAAVQGVFLTTLLSMVTIPLLMALLM